MDIMDISPITGGKLSLEKGTFDLVELAANVVAKLARSYGEGREPSCGCATKAAAAARRIRSGSSRNSSGLWAATR